MAKTVLGEVEVEVDGKSWILLADFNALCDFEEVTGIKALDFVAEVESGGNPKMLLLRDFVHACLKQRHPDAKKTDAGRIMSVDQKVIERTFDAAFPKAEDLDPDDASGEKSGVRPSGET